MSLLFSDYARNFALCERRRATYKLYTDVLHGTLHYGSGGVPPLP